MPTKIQLHAYAKTDRNGKVYYFIRSSDVDMLINLKDFVGFIYPYTKDGKMKAQISFCPADHANENRTPDD